MLAGCGGVSDVVNPASSTADAQTPPTVSISGSPATSVTAGSAYSFTPTASDSDGGTLAFSVANLPTWATFNTATGQISGTPTSTNTGTAANIIITAADGSVKASLAAFSITVTSATTTGTTSGTATVSWAAPTENTNGTALTNLAGFRIYYGTDSNSLSQTASVADPTTLSYVIKGLASG
ncbi:MAG TPA: putative Ig domain-containing protein, partial [Steroidobacteraceae bacterium]|nr:putative Ig domain-containing protein [Steroidobacteraceae bacterium]